MQPPIEQPENENENILVDATLEQNNKLDELNDSNEAQLQGIIQTNEQLEELNSGVDLLVEKLSEEKPEVQKIEIMGAQLVTIKGKDGKDGYTPVKDKDYFDGKDGYTPIKDKDYFDGKDGITPSEEELKKILIPFIPKPIKGDDYILTSKDKKEIAKSIDVPIIEKIIEKTEVIKEKAVKDTAKQIKKKLLEEGLDYSEVQNTPDIPTMIRNISSKTVSLKELDDVILTGLTITDGKYELGSGTGSGGVSKIIAGTNVTISPVSGLGDVTVNATGGGGSQNLQEVTDIGATTTNPIEVKSIYLNNNDVNVNSGYGVYDDSPGGSFFDNGADFGGGQALIGNDSIPAYFASLTGGFYSYIAYTSGGEFRSATNTVILANDTNAITATGDTELNGKLRILGGTKYSIFQGGSQASDITYTLPTAVGAAGSFLKDVAGNGVLSWATVSASGISFGTTTQIPYMNAGGDDFLYGAGLTYDGTYLLSPSIIGSSAANGDLTINGTSSATKTTSYVLLQTAGGNVGIGTTAPLAKFEVLVSGTANTVADPVGLTNIVAPTQTGAGSSLSLMSNDAQAADTGGILGFGGRYTGTAAHANWALIKGLKFNGTSGEYGGYLSFCTRIYNTPTAERVRITNAGAVPQLCVNNTGVTSPIGKSRLVVAGTDGGTNILTQDTGGFAAFIAKGSTEADLILQHTGATAGQQAFYFRVTNGRFDILNLADNLGSIANYCYSTSYDGKMAMGYGVGNLTEFNATLNVGGTGEQLRVGYNSGRYFSVTVDSANKVLIENKVANDIEIDCGTSKTIVLTQPVFNDYAIAAHSLHNGATPPTWAAYNGTLMAPEFINAATCDLHGSFEILHDYKEGTDLDFHIHWSPSTTNAGNCNWVLDYSIANIDGTWSAPTTVSITPVASGVVRKHSLTSFGTISGSTLTIGAVLDFRIYRLGNDASDTFTGNAFLHNVGLHHQSDTLGSRTISAK